MNILATIAELRALPMPDLVARYTEVCGRAPRVKNRAFLWKRIAHTLQTRALGGLSKVAKSQLEALMAQIEIPDAEGGASLRAPVRGREVGADLAPGAVLVRNWKGRELVVKVLDSGFEHEGVLYKSLSAVARAITGAGWNGRLFFGLTKRVGAA